MTQRAPVLVVLCALCVFPAWALVAGGQNATEFAALSASAREVFAWTLAPEGSIVRHAPSPRALGASAAEVVWEVETSQEWTSYRDALRETLPNGYELRHTSSDRISAVEALSGDLHRAEVTLKSSGPEQRIVARFTAMAW